MHLGQGLQAGKERGRGQAKEKLGEPELRPEGTNFLRQVKAQFRLDFRFFRSLIFLF